MDIRFEKANLHVLILGILLALLFKFVPCIDIGFTSLFYNASEGGFYLNQNLVVQAIYLGVKLICVFTTVCLLYFIYRIYEATGSLHPREYAKIIYVILVIAMGPGAVIHFALKETIDRPRPRHVVEFGGDREFKPVFTYNFNAEHMGGKSFVSGHSAVGFMFFSLAFLAKGAFRRNLFIGSTLLGVFIGMGRVMQGGHFLSDVVFSGFTVYFTALFIGIAMSKLFFPLEHK